MMKIQEFQIRFLTPAFLGNAEQSGQWRVPPFKAQLRQWWRVAYAADCRYGVNVQDMRRVEGKLFGNAWLEKNFSKSRVILRLDSWSEGKLKQWESLDKVTHPEVKGSSIGSDLYLGYGPLKGSSLKKNAAIQKDESATLAIAYPESEEGARLIERALWLMDRFGTVGGRSRNGWGSYILTPQGDTTSLVGSTPLREWKEALTFDWPSAVGRDQRGALIWRTQPHDDWKGLMQALARCKIEMRTQEFKFPNSAPGRDPEPRHWLSYPITNHKVGNWDKNHLRLPNSLRFKVRPASHAEGKLVAEIFHMPCLPPASFHPDRSIIETVWQRVYGFLDKYDGIVRVTD